MARKTKGVDALRKKDHPLIVCAVARVLWADRVVGRAKTPWT
jgi:pre-mRNA-processing factor 6